MIDYLPLKRITAMHLDEIQQAVAQTVASGWYLQGESVARFEKEYANYIGTSHCVSCANGLDALRLIFRAYIEMGIMRPGDEVIVPANTYIASILAISENNLIPVLVEPDIDTLQIDNRLIESHITARTRAILIVHLYGRCAHTTNIARLCQKHKIRLIEDNAQAHGCTFEGKRTGSLGDAAAHSFYPGKNLGALGDAGAITTNNEQLAQIIRTLANYGSSRKYVFPLKGMNSRMDELQAAVLSIKLKYLDRDNLHRKRIAQRFVEEIKNRCIILPQAIGRDNVNHIFPILCPHRNSLQQHLQTHGIGTLIHYPIPPHRQQAYAEWNNISLPITEKIHNQELSLPCHPAMTDEETTAVIDSLNRFHE